MISTLFVDAQQTPKLDTTKLIGTWKVDLRPTPKAPDYFKSFEVAKVDGNTFTGVFYGTEIQNGRINTDWETVYLAFTTEDNSGVYNHFAKLVGNRLEGASHSLGRKFLLPWRAEKESPMPTKQKASLRTKKKAATNKSRTAKSR